MARYGWFQASIFQTPVALKPLELALASLTNRASPL